MDQLLAKQDLVNNPSTRVPICLCLDVSGSMNRIIGGQTRSTGRKEFIDGKEWDIVEGGISAIQSMCEGVNLFYDEILADDIARYAAEVCIVTFGGNKPELIVDFGTVYLQEDECKNVIPSLEAKGETPMGEAVNLALDCLENRKQKYKSVGNDYFQPWLVLMTDGEPNGSVSELNRAIARTNELANNRKLTIFPIGIGDGADMKTLNRFSPRRPAVHLKNMNFKAFFEWLSKSVAKTSQSIPGSNVKLPDHSPWMELD